MALPSAYQVVCFANVNCCEPSFRQGNLVSLKQWLVYFSAELEANESSMHNTKTHMEVIRRFIFSGVNSVPHAGAEPLSSGFKADVVKLAAPWATS